MFQVLSTLLVRSLVVLQFLLQIGDLGLSLAALAGKTLVYRIDWNIDEPGTGACQLRSQKVATNEKFGLSHSSWVKDPRAEK